MSNTNTGGPAFPSSEWDGDYQRTFSTGGMTLRDYFAAKALVGLMSTERANEYVDEDGVFSDEDGTLFVHTKFLAEEAYMIADAMIAAREAK